MDVAIKIDDIVIRNAHEAHLFALLESSVNAAARESASAHYPKDSFYALLVGPKDIAAAKPAVMARAAETNYESLIPKSSSLRPLFDKKDSLHRDFLEEAVARIDQHKGEVGAMLLGGCEPTEIVALYGDGADSHKGSRHTLTVETDAGRFLYKPRCLKADAVVQALCEKLFPGRFLIPAVIDCGSYGFCQYVQNQDPHGEDQLDAYFSNLGVFCALAHFLSISDLHAENFLACGSKVVPIDLETVLASALRQKKNPSGASFADDLKGSIIGTGMLNCGNGNLYGAILAGVRHTILPLDGCRDTLNHRDVILEGFQHGFNTCLANKDEIAGAIDSLRGMPVRILFENTRFYHAVQKRLFNSATWHGEASVRDMQRLLRSRKRGLIPPEVLESEAQDIEQGDIPYFFLNSDETAIRDARGVLIEGYLEESPVAKARRRLELLDAAEGEFQARLLAKVIEEMPLINVEAPPPLSSCEDPLQISEATEEAAGMLEQLFCDVMQGKNSQGGLWAARYGETHKSPMNESLSTGYAGAGVFAAACLASGVGRTDHAQAILDICLHEIGCYVKKVQLGGMSASAVDCGLAEGLGGLFRALQLMWRYCHDDRISEVFKALLVYAEGLDYACVCGCNVYNGLAGLVLALSKEETGLPCCSRIDAMADELLRRGVVDGHRVWREPDGSCGALGYGKGVSGIGLALMYAWQATGNPSYWDACCDAIAYEHDCYSAELGFWPLKTVSRGKGECAPGICRGVSGQALVFSQTLRGEVPLGALNADRARQCLDSISPALTDNLCCGTSSIVEGMMALNMHDRAGRLLRAQLARKNQLGFYVHEDSRRAPFFNPGLFFGCLGVGYEMLRYANPESIESVFT